MIYGGATMFAQNTSSNFYSTYDVRELVKEKQFKGIDFSNEDMSIESISELKGGGSEGTKSITYACRIQATGEDAFDLANFLEWLSEETIKQIESGKGTLTYHRHKIGKRFLIEYSQQGFVGRVEVDGDIMGKDEISVDVDVIERSSK
jgi:outer membrane PBP1 activator LpoA protein